MSAGSAGKVYWPAPSVTAVNVPASRGDDKVTVTPGSAAPDMSVTRPVRRPAPSWAVAPSGARTRARPTRRTRIRAEAVIVRLRDRGVQSIGRGGAGLQAR